MNNILNITPEKVAESIRSISGIMNCDYETAWKKYTHEIIKSIVRWEDVEPLLNEKQ